MLVEVHVPNADGTLLPGMYAQVDLSSARSNPPLLVPSDTLIVRADGTLVALVREDHTIHLQPIQVGRDYGNRLEVLTGLQEGDSIILNPGDMAREGLRFTLKDREGPGTVAVVYTGSVPDLFKPGREVMLKGQMEGDTFVAEPDSLVTKCPSKYAPEDT